MCGDGWIGGDNYCRNNTAQAGRELWAVTPAGVGTRLTDIWPGRGGSGIDNLTRTAAGWFFTADDPSGGRQLWTIAAAQ